MATMNISIPEPMREWVEERVRSGQYVNASECIGGLIREDRARRERLVQALIEGEESGLSSRSVSDIVADAKSAVRDGKI